MKEFTVIFQTSSGRGRMKVLATNKDSANKSFLVECTRQGIKFIEIIDIQCTDVNVRPTVDQEKKALRQIEVILEDIGDKSHLAAAFDGCVEVAKYNIEHDAYDSFQFLLNNSYSQSGEYERRLLDVEQRFRNYIDRTTDQIKSMDEEMQRLKSGDFFDVSENIETCFARYLKSTQSKISSSIKELEDAILSRLEVCLSNHEPLGDDVARLHIRRDKLLEISKAIKELLELF